ncbi:MAG: ABC transporter ATP-binding protein [Anaerolineae bacterium]
MAILEIRQLSKSFGGLQAVLDFNCVVNPGEIHALIGPNGAGKSTVFNLVCNLIKPDSGKVLLNGENLVGLPPHRITEKGIGRTFQNVRLFKNISVRANVAVAVNAARGYGIFQSILNSGPGSALLRSVYEEADQVLEIVGLTHRANSLPKNLPYGEQKRVELARALACPVKVLLLDEPTTGMNPTESETMLELIQSLRQRGIAILLVEHNMRVVMGISDIVTVMNFGQVIAEGTPVEVCNNERVISAYLGERRNARAQ